MSVILGLDAQCVPPPLRVAKITVLSTTVDSSTIRHLIMRSDTEARATQCRGTTTPSVQHLRGLIRVRPPTLSNLIDNIAL